MLTIATAPSINMMSDHNTSSAVLRYKPSTYMREKRDIKMDGSGNGILKT